MATASSLTEIVKKNFLQLSGGTISGIIKANTHDFIERTVDNSYTAIRGGSGFDKGSSLVLYGKDESDGARFRLIANDGTNIANLIGKANGELLWNSRNVAVVDTWRSGNSWYRKYSDGWIEQGGSVVCSTDISASSTNITFTTPFATSVNILGGFVKAPHNASFGQLWFQNGTTSLTGCIGSVIAYAGNGNVNHNSCSGGTCYWYASGYQKVKRESQRLPFVIFTYKNI